MKRSRKYEKQWIMILAVFLAVSGVLTGCGKGESDKRGGAGAAAGHYVEEDMELPVKEGEKVINLTKSGQGNLVLYSQAEGALVYRYEYKEGKWEQESLDWVSQIYDGENIFLQEIQETKDGMQVARGMDGEMLTHMARNSGGQKGELLEIPYLKQQGEYGYPAITNLQIDGAGNYWLYDMYLSKITVIDPESLETIREINSAQGRSSIQRMFFCAENGDMAVNTEDGVFTIFDSELKETGELRINQPESDSAWMCNVKENWYLISPDGITRMTLGNETSEVIMDGSKGEMGSSVSYVTGFAAGAEDDFYALYTQGKAETSSLAHYVYDADAPAATEHTLQVFALAENQTVQEAVRGFQKEHPDVEVVFQTSGKAEGITTDDIRTLNTELLGGNGADILLLDGLSVKTYAEKGILADLTALTEEVVSQETYLEAVLKNTAQADGKVYGMPVKFSVPIVYGNEQAKKAILSLDELKAYVDTHSGQSIVGIAEREYIRDFLFQMYQDEIIREDGKVDQEKLTALLETAVKIAANAKTEAFDEVNSNDLGMGMVSKIFQQGMFSNAGSAAILNYPESIATGRISSVMDMMIPYTIMRQMDLSPDTLKDYYIPHGIVGINQGTKEKKLAEEFVKYLFSQEVQEKPLDDGFPVLVSVLDKMKDEVDSEYAQSLGVVSSWSIEGEDEIEVEAGYPTAEEVEDLIGKCRTLSNPAVQDCVIWSIYQTEADACLGGSIDAAAAAKNIAQKVDTYLAE